MLSKSCIELYLEEIFFSIPTLPDNNRCSSRWYVWEMGNIFRKIWCFYFMLEVVEVHRLILVDLEERISNLKIPIPLF